MLVTGATGAVGSALVPLLADAASEVRLLVRSDNAAAAETRLEGLFRSWGWDADRSERRRVSVVHGDAAAPHFALDEAAYAALAAATTDIVHCAASVRMNLPIEEARRSAVGSAREVLELARRVATQGRLGKVECVSTVGVGGRRRAPIAETWVDPTGPFHNTYEQSKAEAEVLFRHAIEVEGLPLTVHRPSMVVGSSSDGGIIHFQIFYYICEFLSGRRTRGWYPRLTGASLDIIPVDRVAEAIAASLADPSTAGRIFHLCAGPGRELLLDDLQAGVRRLFASRGLAIPAAATLPRSIFALLMRLAAFTAPPADRRAIATLPIYLDYLAGRQVFTNHAYATWLRTRGQDLHDPKRLLAIILGRYLAVRDPGRA
ncbi:MAG: SDR family oxidoreductase [Caulobacterales bacterium]|nr:SDR family oxidoreductase [Caulobacterales bacterium]